MADTSPAQAQTPQNSYGPAQCTGGTHTVQGAGGASYTPASGVPYGGGDSYNNACTVSCTGGITAMFTWNGPNPPPQKVSFLQSCVASWSGAGSTPPTGSCSNGLGDAAVPVPSNPHASGATSGEGGNGQPIYHYLSMTGAQTIMLPVCNAQASATSGLGDGVSASVSYTAAVTPIILTINPGGSAVQDSSGNWDILVGQQCSPAMTVSPSGYSLSNYQWSVTGTTFQSWSATTPALNGNAANPDASYYDGGPGILDGPNPTSTPPVPGPSWYWNDASSTTETITCTATVTPPAGEGSAFTVTATQQVHVLLPNWSCSGTGGQMYIGSGYDVKNPSNYYLFAGPVSDPGYGMGWLAHVSAPSNTSFGAGTLQMVQTEVPNATFTSSNGNKYIWSNNGQNGLDTSYPYPWVTTPSQSSQNYTSGDGPGIEVTGTASASLKDQFKDYLMYMPPGSGSQWVTVGTLSWSTNGSATIPASGKWADAAEPDGTVSPSGQTQFTADNTFPSWTQNVGNGVGQWVLSP